MRSSMKCGATSLCGNYVGRSISRMTRHGLPAAKTCSGMAPPPTQTSAPISTGAASTRCRRPGRRARAERDAARLAGLPGWRSAPGKARARDAGRGELRIERVVQLARQHFSAFGQGSGSNSVLFVGWPWIRSLASPRIGSPGSKLRCVRATRLDCARCFIPIATGAICWHSRGTSAP
jgi:hypothetical protein